MTEVPAPAWIAASLKMMNEGRDPLGLQTTTQDRLMPLLLPRILELFRRARYFSFHERTTGPLLPHLFQRVLGARREVISPGTI